MVIDDTIEEKPYTDESELVCWHYDHSKGRSVKGVNLISALYQAGDVSVPVAFELVRKSGWVFDSKKGKWQRKSLKTKNELYRCRSCTYLSGAINVEFSGLTFLITTLSTTLQHWFYSLAEIRRQSCSRLP